MKKLSWDTGFGDDQDERERNNILMNKLIENDIPFTIGKEPGQLDENPVIIIENEGYDTLYVGTGFNGYFIDMMKVFSILRGIYDVEELVKKIKSMI